MRNIREELLKLRDDAYRAFTSSMIPNIPPERIAGVRTPILRTFRRSMSEEAKSEFIRALPHYFLEENMLHMHIIGEIRDFEVTIDELEKFIPFIDNWAVCDAVSIKGAEENSEALLLKLREWAMGSYPYFQRIVCVILLKYFTKDKFSPEQVYLLDLMKIDDYYVRMGKAWYLS